MAEERLRILKMVESGQIGAGEAAELLQALDVDLAGAVDARQRAGGGAVEAGKHALCTRTHVPTLSCKRTCLGGAGRVRVPES